MKKSAPILFIILLFVIAGWFFFTQEPVPVDELPEAYAPPTIPAPSEQTEPEPEEVVALPEPEPVAEPEVVLEPLPPLHESDDVIKPALGEIVGPDLLEEYIVKDQLISRLVATVDSLTSRQVPPPINPAKPVADKLIVEKRGDEVILSPQNFARYEPYVTLLNSVDTPLLMSTYDRYAPLFQQAWEENGQQGSFDQRLIDVIDHLVETPDVSGPVYLVKPEAFYLYEDPELEAMTAGQKILVRMGSANAALVKAKLIEIRNVLQSQDF